MEEINIQQLICEIYEEMENHNYNESQDEKMKLVLSKANRILMKILKNMLLYEMKFSV